MDCENSKKLCNIDKCKICFNRSFASHEKSKEWNYELNKNIKPRDITKKCNKKFWFKCKECNHIRDQSIGNITRLGRGCKYCTNQALCDDESCIFCYNNSFASHEKSQFWDYSYYNNLELNLYLRKVFK
jgi:hypothetical protein